MQFKHDPETEEKEGAVMKGRDRFPEKFEDEANC